MKLRYNSGLLSVMIMSYGKERTREFEHTILINLNLYMTSISIKYKYINDICNKIFSYLHYIVHIVIYFLTTDGCNITKTRKGCLRYFVVQS